MQVLPLLAARLTVIGLRFKEEPLVPLGMTKLPSLTVLNSPGVLGTCAALLGAQRALRRGNSRRANRFFRYRVYAQGFTVLALVVGGFMYGNERRAGRSQREQMAAQLAKTRRDEWLNELEEYNRTMEESSKTRKQ